MIDFGEFTITKREILLSIAIIAILLALGLWISEDITEWQMDKNAVYDQALRVDTTDIFEYGMRTNVGNAFVYGDLKAVDTVSFSEIGGEYMTVRKIKERYTKHTRTVTKTRTVNGKTKTYTEVETYWTWDEIDRETLRNEKITFLGVEFERGKIEIPCLQYIDTIKESSKIRYKYYGTGTEFVGTIHTDLRDGTISDSSEFYEGRTIEQTIEHLKVPVGTIGFWIFWVLLMCGAVFGFFYIDNCWLE
jgi:hypothetical protein